MNIKTLQVTSYGTNCYILCDETSGVCAVVDPGGEASRVTAAVEATGCTPCAVLLTHGHLDHVGAAEALTQRWPGLPVYLNRRDTALSADAYAAQLFPVPHGTVSYDEGDRLQVGTLTVEVLATPGHSEGSVVLRCGGTLFCGDTLFAGSMGRTDFPGGSERKIMESLRRLASLEGDYKVLPGHMEPSTLERERQTNPYVRYAMKNVL